MKALSFFLPLLLLTCALVLTGCGSSFNHAWTDAMHKPVPTSGIEGPWTGSWLSHTNGHHGELKCVVGPDKKGDGERTFLYHAVWGGVLSGTFKAVHHVKQDGPLTRFTADSDLGIYGHFHAEGTVQDSQFKATFKAAGDNGVFEMKRPGK